MRGMMGSFLQSMLGYQMHSAGMGGNPRECSEGEWIDLPTGALFRAVKELDVDEVERLLEDGEYKEAVDEEDGDGFAALFTLALSDKATLDDAKSIVAAFDNAGADLDARASGIAGGETPLMAAACYGHFNVIKAFIDGGATVDIADDKGNTVSSRAEEHMKSPRSSEEDARKSLNVIQTAVEKERGSRGDGMTAQERRGEELRKLGNEHYAKKEWEEAADLYQKSYMCHEDHRAYGNRAAACLEDAIERLIVPGGSGYRQKFKETYADAARAVELNPTYEKGWYRKSRGYLGFRELPRAKEAAREGLTH